MPEKLPVDPVWNALQTVHAHFALRNGTAVRYPADVVPFAAMDQGNHSDLSPLAQLLTLAEHVYVIGAQPQATNILRVGPALNCFQMIFPLPPPANAVANDSTILHNT